MSEAVIAQRSPYGVDVEEGQEYYWCACGRSQKQPFCDGSHKVTTLRPVQYLSAATETVYFCGCKRTGNRPLCDGSHRNL